MTIGNCPCGECNPCDQQSIPESEELQITESPLIIANERQSLLESTKTERTPLPKRQIAALLFVFLPESFTSTLIYPFVVELVRSVTGLARRGPESLNTVTTTTNPASVGYYTGLIESSFFFTEAICVSVWSHLSDRVGRKPVLLFGLSGLTAAMLSFGFSTTLFGIIGSRALQGALNGNVGVARAMLTELTDLTNRDQAFSFIPVVWATGSTLGPFVGGLLARPADRFSLFDVPFWHKHPYLLPCVAAAFLSSSVFLSTLTLIKETHPAVKSIFSTLSKITARNSNPKPPAPSYGTIERTVIDENVENRSYESAPQPRKEEMRLSLLLTPRLFRVLINHALLAILEHSYLALVALFYPTPIESGGLGLSPSQVGILLGTTGLVHGILQPFCFSTLYRTFHPKTLYTLCIAASLPAYACFPCVNALARVHGAWYPGVWILVVIQAALLLPSYTTFSAMGIFISTSAPSPALLGTTMGVSQTLFSSMGTIGPSGVTSLFAISQERNLLGGNLVYVVMCSLVAIAVAASHFVLPDDPHLEPERQD